MILSMKVRLLDKGTYSAATHSLLSNAFQSSGCIPGVSFVSARSNKVDRQPQEGTDMWL